MLILSENRRTATRVAVVAAVLIAALALPPLFGIDDFTLTQLEVVLAMIVVGLGLHVAMGLAGQFALGMIATFTASGFTVAWAATKQPELMSLPAMLVLGALAGAVGGLILALPALRVGQFYLALVTLYAAVTVPAVAMHWDALGGEAGLVLFTVLDFQPSLEGFDLYAVSIGVVAVLIAVGALLERSTVGRRFAALAASEQLADSIGISRYRTKVLACTLGSAIAGIAGGLFVYTQQIFGPSVGGAQNAILLLAAMMIGGFGTLSGLVLGVAAVFGFLQFVTGLERYTGIIFGAFLLACVLFLPNGLIRRSIAPGRRWWRWREPGSAPARPDTGAGAPPDSLPALPRQENRLPLRLRSVARAFGGVQAVGGVDLVVQPGTIYGLIGSNGSGKTTLLNLISGFYRLDSGTIEIGEVVVSGRSADRVARSGIARTFQTPKLITDRTVLENVVPAAERTIAVTGIESVFRLGRGPRAARRARAIAHDALDRLALGHLADVEVGSLPHGTRRLVEIARAIALRPAFLLCDEPAAGLSPAEMEVMVGALGALARSGAGVLLIEHNIPLVLDLAADITVLHQGTVLFRGTPDDLRADRNVAEAFLGIDQATGALE